MRIEYKNINDLIPAEYNPRKIKKKEFDKLKRSIEWDKDKLFSVLENLKIQDFDITLTGFELNDLNDYKFDKDVDIGYFGDERERTFNTYRLNEYDATRTEGFYQIPTLKACHFIPEKLISFKYVKGAKEKDYGVHFFIDDYQFERIWNSPQKIINRLSDFQCVFTPDFSLYMDMPMAMKIWNVYRSRFIGQMMQDAGIQVIPTLSWAEEITFDFCFEGIEQGGVVAVSTVGVMRDKNAQKIWNAGMNKALEIIKPECILCYGYNADIGFDFGGINVKYFKATVFK